MVSTGVRVNLHSLLSTLQRLRRVVELTEDRLITFPSIALFLRLIQLFPKEQQSLHLSERLLEHLLMELNHRSLIRDSLDQLSTQRPGLMIQERFTQWRTRTLSSLHFPITNRSPNIITGDRISRLSPQLIFLPQALSLFITEQIPISDYGQISESTQQRMILTHSSM